MRRLFFLLASLLSASACGEPGAIQRNYDDPRIVELVTAAGNGDAATVKRLVALGISPEAEGSEGLTPIVWAIGRRSEAGVQALLDAGVSTNFCPPRSPCILGAAARGKQDWLLKLLLKNGADPNTKIGNQSLLRLALMGGSDRNIDTLLDAGANVNTIDVGGATPVLVAAKINQFGMVMHLIERGGGSPHSRCFTG